MGNDTRPWDIYDPLDPDIDHPCVYQTGDAGHESYTIARELRDELEKQ